MSNARQSVNNELTIVVNTCDSYADVLKLFFAAFDEYWKDCKYKIVVNTQEKKYEDIDAVVVNYYSPDGVDHWGDRLLRVLDSIDSDYVLMLYDDFILEDFVDQNAIDEVLELLNSKAHAAVCYLIDTKLPVESVASISKFSAISKSCDYRLNSAPAIWSRSELIRYTGKIDNPWAWEVFGSYRTYGDGFDFFTLSPSVEDVYKYNYSKGGAIYRGRWVRNVVHDKFDKYKLEIDPSIRGYSDDAIIESRSIKWKIDFILLGYKMVGFKFLIFVVRYLRAKIHE